MELIYTAVLFVMMFVNIALMFLGVRLLSLVVWAVTLGMITYCLNASIFSEIPFAGWIQFLVGMVASVCMLVVAVRGKYIGD